VAGSLGVTLNNREFILLAPGGVYDTTTETLLVADTHFGKDATFRHHSIPVPAGSNASTIRKIQSMISKHTVSRLIILGDMFHDRTSLATETRDRLDQFFAKHQNIDSFLVPGNHDTGINALPKHWNIRVIETGSYLDGITLSHYPITSEIPGPSIPENNDSSDHIHTNLCGHLHPAIRIGSAIDQVKLPCFLFRDGNLILPAIGDFTGTHTINPRRSDRVWVVAEDEIVEWFPRGSR